MLDKLCYHIHIYNQLQRERKKYRNHLYYWRQRYKKAPFLEYAREVTRYENLYFIIRKDLSIQAKPIKELRKQLDVRFRRSLDNEVWRIMGRDLLEEVPLVNSKEEIKQKYLSYITECHLLGVEL